MGRLNHLCKAYLGTHSYHNLTKGYKSNDPRCDRFMTGMKVELLEQEVVDKTVERLFETEEERNQRGMRFVRFTLTGQSFIYHQIRKMVGLLIKICYEELDGDETMKLALGK